MTPRVLVTMLVLAVGGAPSFPSLCMARCATRAAAERQATACHDGQTTAETSVAAPSDEHGCRHEGDVNGMRPGGPERVALAALAPAVVLAVSSHHAARETVRVSRRPPPGASSSASHPLRV